MKKYFNYLLILSLVFTFFINSVSLKTAKASTNTCTKDTVYNSDGTPCSLIASCPPGVDYDFRTGLLCPGVTAQNTQHDYYADYLVETLKTAKNGTKSIDVANLQAFLIENNLLDIKYGTTYYGPITTEALKSFQSKHDLKVDGRMGPEVLSKMKEVITRTPNSARDISTMAKRFVAGKKNITTASSTPVEFTKGVDLNKESSWGLAVAKNSRGEGIIYVRDFGLDPKNGKLNTMTTFVDRFE